jgi:hypothetical protein
MMPQKLGLRISYQDALKRIHEQVVEGERIQPSNERPEDALDKLKAESRIWADCTREVLVQVFASSDISFQFTEELKSWMQSGSFHEWIQDEKRSIFRGVTFLRSLEKRLVLSRTDTRSKRALQIPFPVIATVADVLAAKYTHARLDFLMKKAGVTGAPPEPGKNKIDRSRNWLELANSENEPLNVLGKAIEEVMEVDSFGILTEDSIDTLRQKIRASLSKHGLGYRAGGNVFTFGTGAVARTLEQMARQRDLLGVQTEFDRIFESLDKDPPSAVTASCALLESLFKVYIEEQALTLPSDQSIKSLWAVVRKDLKFDPAVVQDDNLKKILSGLASIVDGIAALRTHKGSAHGHGKSGYRVKPRHARLAVHAASTLATFILETWDENKT